MGRLLLLLVIASCRFEPGQLGDGDGGGVTDSNGDGGDGDAMLGDSMVTPPRTCTFHLGSDHSCSVRTSDGTIRCVGLNGFGELGRGTTGGSSTTVTKVDIDTTLAASSRSYHACIATAARTVQCWGFNDAAQIGDGTTTTRPSPTTVTNLSNVVELAVARSFSCARRLDNSITCWGGNSDGQLGDGSTTPQSTPQTSVGIAKTPIAISAGSSHGCALFTDATAACWGRNAYGQLGDGTQTSRPSPVAAPVTGIRQIAPSGYSTGEGMGGQTCALLTNGTVRCWGSNDFGQLGNGAMSGTPSLSAVTVTGIIDGVELSMGRYHACVRHGTNGGSVSCWGRNSVGEVGDNSTTDRAVPTLVTLPRPAVHVVAGGFHTCALLDDDSVQCWGENGSGQLGDGTQTTRVTPVSSALCPTL